MADLSAGLFRIRYNNARNEYSIDGGLTWAVLGSGAVVGTDWYSVESAAAVLALPTLTAWQPVQPGLSHSLEALGANALDAGIEGGAVKGQAGAWQRFNHATIWQNLKTSVLSTSFQIQANTQGSYFGIIDPTSAFGVLIQYAAANWELSCIGTGGTIGPINLGARDTALNTWRFDSDATTLKIYKNSVLIPAGNTPTSTAFFPTQQGTPGFSWPNAAGGGVVKNGYGYVGF